MLGFTNSWLVADMTLDKLNPWLSFIGNIAILMGLMAVAIEIRDNSVAVRSQELGALRELNQERYLAMLSPDLASMYVKSLQNPAEMTTEELWGMANYVNIRVSLALRGFRAYQNGILGKNDWDAELSGVPLSLDTPLGKLLWQNIKADYADSPEFVLAVDNAIATNTIATDDRWLADLQVQAKSLGQSPEQSTRKSE
jgi:hypothetical protein